MTSVTYWLLCFLNSFVSLEDNPTRKTKTNEKWPRVGVSQCTANVGFYVILTIHHTSIPARDYKSAFVLT